MTTRAAAGRWLDERLAAAPPELASDVRALVRAVADDSPEEHGDAIARLLARAGLAGLDEIVDGRGGRESALRLLAADAALTLAFEAAAELDGNLPDLCTWLGPSGEIGKRLERERGTGGGS
jgi:hypothetical protein